MEKNVEFGGWHNCIRLSNAECELIVTTDIGPRIVRFGFLNKQNFLYQDLKDSGKAGGAEWRLYGGHRFWVAPEMIPRSYLPDNDRLSYFFENNILSLIQKEDEAGLVKEMEIYLSPSKNEVRVLHRIRNNSGENLELSIWPITAMAPNGRAIIPQEPYGRGDKYLLPARPIALWQYTRMNDPRWLWGDNYIQAMHHPTLISEQKIGVLNKQCWMAYYLNQEVLIKLFPYDPSAIYPDCGCNNEVYIDGNFLEMETLSPLVYLQAGHFAEHTEHWVLEILKIDGTEESIQNVLLPIVKQAKQSEDFIYPFIF
jgi:hypothetical protein